MTTSFQNRDLVEVKKIDKNNFPQWKQHIQFIFTFQNFREIVNITHANDVEDIV
jgi:transposase-like protein